MTIHDLKLAAKRQISGKIGELFFVNLIAVVILCVVNLIPIIGSIAAYFVISPAITLGLTMIYITIASDWEIEIGDVFKGFNRFFDAFKVQFFVSLFTFLWSLLFIIPGIIKSLSYSMAMYIMADEPGIDALDAINKSARMMEGHRMELFLLELSFIGWGLLCVVTLGIASVYVVPYEQTTMTNFYFYVKGEYENYDTF
ncbi:MAG: DUF975 family protein [Ruminococcaceae bacterium]|nr:DUF975 family protein [Oscillospiraceae bacterium]